MKKICFVTAFLCLGLHQLNAQNWFPTAGGNAGIGTQTPTSALHIKGTANNDIFVQTTDDGYASLTLQSDGKTWQWTKRPSYELDAMSLFYNNGTSWASSPYFTIQTNGHVGIGTTSLNDANYLLFVETGIKTRKIKVDANSWADYVFDKSYNLRPLSEVEGFIKKYQHLPDVQSAADAKKDGVDLGESQTVLLKKIEELTLYLIEQNKQLAEQQKLLQQQQQELEEQSKRIKLLEKKSVKH